MPLNGSRNNRSRRICQDGCRQHELVGSNAGIAPEGELRMGRHYAGTLHIDLQLKIHVGLVDGDL
jgi:hypothetical protein